MIDPTLTAIEDAALTPVEYRAARRLLDQLPPGHVLLHLTADEAMTVCGVNSWAGARRILAGLAKAKLIELHTNSRAYIHFLHRAEMDHSRAETARGGAEDRAEMDHGRAETARGGAEDRAETDHSRAEMARQRAETDQNRADSASPLGKDLKAGKVGKEGSPTLPDLEGSGEPQPPQPDAAPISPAEQARSLALLTDPDVGINGKLLAELAATYPFRQIRLQVFRALRDLAAGDVKTLGVIKHRLKYGTPATVTDADRESDLWARHDGLDEELRLLDKWLPVGYEDIVEVGATPDQIERLKVWRTAEGKTGALTEEERRRRKFIRNSDPDLDAEDS